jgi:hypothetical protein
MNIHSPIPAANRAVTAIHNQPPTALDHAADALSELAGWLKDHPIIQALPEAKAGVGLKERTLVALNSAREERQAQTQPLRDQLNEIFAAYDLVKDKGTLERGYNELRKRLTAFATSQEEARIAEATRLRNEAAEAERIAREAETAEQEALANAEQGECTDVGAAIAQADVTFTEYRVADKQAAIAERNVPLRFGSVLGGKSISMRTTEVLAIENVELAIKTIGLTDKIVEAILSSARDFRREFNELPAGIKATFNRSL